MPDTTKEGLQARFGICGRYTERDFACSIRTPRQFGNVHWELQGRDLHKILRDCNINDLCFSYIRAWRPGDHTTFPVHYPTP